MRRLSNLGLAAAAVSAIAFCSGCQSSGRAAAHPVELRLEGTPGLAFTGTYRAEGQLHNVGGTVPKRFTISEPPVEYSFQKAQQNGELEIWLYRDTVPVGHAVTSKPFGQIQGSVTADAVRTGG